MDFFDIEFPELPSIAPDLMFEEEPLPVRNIFTPALTPIDRETLLHFVLDDHAYAKPYPILSTANNKCVTPQTILKLHTSDLPVKKKYKRNQSKYQSHGSEDDDEIDVVTVNEPYDFVVKYDKTKAHNGMNEVESYLNSLWKDVDKDDDEKIMRGSWTKEQARLFDVVYKLINNYQLAKLAYFKNTNEPVLRKLALDKATQRIREAFGSVLWNPKYIVWLHGIMIDGLGSSLFLCYLEILQSLKRKAPTLFERVLLFDRAASEKELTAGLPNLGVRLKKSWDPSTGLQSKVTVEKFPTTPFLIMVPSGPSIPHQSTKRNRFWNNQLMNFGKVFPINVPAYRTLEGYVIKHYLEHCISAIRSKITEFRNRFPERHVILVGWGVGSLISCKVANLDKVDAIVCLGFPCIGIDGDASEDYWKGLTKIECPVLFVIGTHAATNSVTATEKLREQMKTQTNLILIESADEMLRLTKSQKKSLGMTQNMIDKLIQDEIYLFLKSVLFKPKHVITHLPKGPATGKKRKKKVDSAEKGETKKKKKAHVKSSSLLLSKGSDTCLLPPLDVSISSVSSVPLGISQGLLTTGSVSTSIPVTQLQSESLTNLTSTVLQQTVSIGDVVVSTAKDVMKRNIIKEPKEKVKRTKSTKKPAVSKNIGVPPGSQRFTSNIGNPHTVNMISHQFPGGDTRSNKTNVQHPVTFQRVPAGSFVLSGASGQVRLQGGANILYLQQATSGATQLLGTPIINTSSGAFTAVISSNLIGSNPSKINIVPSSNFKFGPANPTITHHNKGLSAIISSGGCGNLVFTSTTAQLLASNVSSSGDTPVNISGNVQMSSMPASSNTNNSAYTIAPSNVASGTAVATTASSTIMTHLSANDLRYLASLIAKHSNSRPNSPMPSSLANPLLFNKTDDKTFLKTSRENPDAVKLSVNSTCVSEIGNNVNKSSLISILDKKGTLNTPNQSAKKVVQPPSLAQRVASIQQKDPAAKMKNPRMKTSKLATTTINMPMGHIITTNTTKISSIPPNSKVLHKVPVTLTIPISRLPSNLNFSSASAYSKSINVPVLSSYLSQDKFILTSTKSSGSTPGSRTILTNPAVAKKSPIMIGNVPVCSSPGKMSNMTVFPCSRAPTPSSSRPIGGGIFITKTPFSSTITPFKSPVKGKNPSPITLHLPSQAALKDPKVLRKAVSDVKVVGVLSQQSKSQIPSLVNLSALRSISNPSSPLRSPTNDSLHGDISPEELSPIQPREQADISELKSEDRKKTSFSPLKSSIMAAIGDNFKPLTPPSIPSSTLLAASIPRDVNVLGRSNITGKVGTSAFLGKLFVGPKSIVEPMRGKISFTKDPNISRQVSSFEHNMDDDDDDDDDEDEDDDDDDDDDDESDVDFAISPAVDSPVINTLVNKPVIFDPIKHSNITKIVYAPNQSSDNKSNLVTPTSLFSRNILDIARAKLRESHFRCAGDGLISPNMGINTLKNMSEPRSSLEEHISSISTNDSKLRFEPLKISSTRAKLTSVLSMRENKFEDCNTMNILQNNSMFTNPIVDSKTCVSAAESKLKENETNPNIVSIQSNRPTTISSLPLKQLSSFHPAPITNFTLLCDSDSSRGLIGRPSGEAGHHSVTFPSTVTNVVSSDERSGRNQDIKYYSAKTNGVTSHEIKETPFSSIQYKGSLFSTIETKETPFSNIESKGASFASIDSKRTSFASVVSKGASLANIETRGTPFANIDSKGKFLGNIENRGTPFANIDSKGTFLGNIENRGTPFANIDSKGTFLGNIEGKGTPFANIDSKGTAFGNIESRGTSFANIETKGTPFTNIETKGTPFPTIETKWPFSNMETKGTSFVNMETKATSFSESPQIAKLFAKPSKPSKQIQEYKMIIEEEPQPYITRSGRVMRSKYSIQYIDELDRKKTPKKRRLSSSTNQDNLPLKKNKITSELSQTSTVTLESLVEAAKLIKKESDSLVNGRSVVMAEKTVNHVNTIPNIDPTANIAATAMLELLSGDTKCIKVGRNNDGEMMGRELNNTNVHKNDVIKGTSSEANNFMELHPKAVSQIPISNCLTATENVILEPPMTKINNTGSGVLKITNNMLLLAEAQSTSLPNLAAIENESTETYPVSRDIGPRNVVTTSVSDKSSEPGVTSIMRNPSDPSLPTLAPIQKVSTEIPGIPTANFEQMPMRDSIADNADIVDNVVSENRSECASSSPIPPLAAIQDKCSENALSLPIELLNPLKKCEFKEELSFNDDKTEISTEPRNPAPFPIMDKDKSKPAISTIGENLVEAPPQIDKLNVTNNITASNLTPTVKCFPTLAVIQEKPIAENSVVTSCSDMLLEQTKVVSPVVVTSSDVFTCTPILHEQHKKRSCEIINQSENEIMMDEGLKSLNAKGDITELTSKESANKISLSDSVMYSSNNLASRLPNSSPPALAVIQSKGHGNLKFNESNMAVADNCSIANTMADITLVNSLPPLAAIQINSADCENLNQPNCGNLSNSERDLNLPRETKKNIDKLEKGGVVLLGASLADDIENTSEPIRSLSPVSKTLDIHDATNELICTDRNFESDSKITEEDTTH